MKYVPQLGDLQFQWGSDPVSRFITGVSSGPSHVRVVLSTSRAAEMTSRGFRIIPLPVDGAHTQTVAMHLSPSQQQRVLDVMKSGQGVRYGYLSCISDFFNRLGSPLTLGIIGQENCSMFAARAVGRDDWATQTPADLYREYAPKLGR